MSLEDAKEVHDEIHRVSEQEHQRNCQMIDDHQTHLERAYSQAMPAEIIQKSMGWVDRYFSEMLGREYNTTHHTVTGHGASQTQIPKESLVRKLAGPVTAAAVTAASGGLGFALSQYLNETPVVEQGAESLLQYLEDGGFHVPPDSAP